MNIDVLLTHGTVIAMDPQRRVIHDGAVAVRDGRILEVGDARTMDAKYTPAKRIDCANKAILPGLVDVHGHAGHALMKCVGMDAPGFWMAVVTPTYHHFTTDDFWYAEGRLAALERLKMGVTCGLSVISSAQRSDDPVFAVNSARGYRDVGIREVVAVGPSNPPYPRAFSRWRDGVRHERNFDFDELMAGTEAAVQATNHMADDRIRAFVAPFVLITSVFGSGASPVEVAAELSDHDRLMMRRVRELAAKYGTRIHTEAFGGMIRLAARDEWALLGPDVHIQHCTGIGLDEVRILAETKTHVASSPGPHHAVGRCPIPEIMAFGGNVAVTTDGVAPAISFDLVQAARSTQLIQRLLTQNAAAMPSGAMLEAITINAARAIGWDDEIGSLEEGKKADIAVLDLWQPHLAPNVMPVHKIIAKAVGNDVETVLVDGKILMENRKVLSVNEDDVLREGHEEAARTIARAGTESALEAPPGFWGCEAAWFEKSPEPKLRWKG